MSSRIFALSLAVFLLLGLAACGPKERPDEPEASLPVTSGGGSLSQAAPEEPDAPSGGPAAPAREPIGSPAVILYPELADETLTASALYKQALERPSVICYQGEPLTDPQPVEDFLAAMEKGEDRDLYLYQFYYSEDNSTPYTCSLVHFLSSGGSVMVGSNYSDNWDTAGAEEPRPLALISMNKHGFLFYREEGVSEATATKVVNDRTFDIDYTEKFRKLRDTYLTPLAMSALVKHPWSLTAELAESVDLVWVFEDLYWIENGSDPWGTLGANWPLDTMLETLSHYFDGITKEMIIGKKYANAYDPQTDTIFYEGGRGGMTPVFRVDTCIEEGDRLSIGYMICDESGAPVEGSLYTLTVRTLEDGSFRYLSNLPQE